MADDLFEDSTMTFGEHIEELRVHLLRAVYGICVVMAVMMYFGANVVKLITEPLEKQLESYTKTKLEAMTKLWRAEQSKLPAELKLAVNLPVEIPADEVTRAMGTIDPNHAPVEPSGPVSLTLKANVDELIEKIALPLAFINRKWSLKSLSVQESIMIWFKAVLGASIVFASPWVFYQIYSFIAVGLYAHERRFVNYSLPFGVALFAVGVAFCYFIMFPLMLRFFLQTNEWMDIEPDIRLSEWVGFAVMLTIIFGLTFQMPLIMVVLERVGIVTYEWLAGKRKHAIMFNFIFAAIATPADPTSQIFLALPMCLLFELGLYLMKYLRRNKPFAVAEPTFDEQF